MRRLLRSILITFVAILGAVGLTVASAFAAALAFGAVALIVPGTGTPNAGNVSGYMEQAQKRYLQGTSCAVAADCTLQGIDYPASFWPLSFIPNWCRSGPDGCDKWDESVGKGTLSLTEQLDYYLNSTDEDIVVFGYSQGGAVVSNVLSDDIAKITDPNVRKRVQIVTIGGIQTPDGGLWSRLGFLHYIPILDVTLTPAMKPVPDVQYTSYAFHFDPVADAPRYWGNPFALLNAVAALQTVHGYYLTPNGNGLNETLPYGYTDITLKPQLVCNVGVNCRVDKDGNKYIVIPATSLPIADLVYQSTPAALRPLIKPFIELVAPAYRVLAELGYDYSGDPSVSTPLSILPFNPFTFNPITFVLKMAGAIVQGIVNAFGGGTSLSPLNPPETAAVTTVQAMSQMSSDPGPQNQRLALVDTKGSLDNDLSDVRDGTAGVSGLGGEQTVGEAGDGAETLQQGVDEKGAVGQTEIDQAAAEKDAADKAAADKDAADKAAADKDAADKATADKDAADKATADKDAAEKKAADKLAAKKAKKEAAEKARKEAAEKEGVGSVNKDAGDDNAPNNTGGAGESEKTAA